MAETENDLLVGFSLQFKNDNKSFALVFNREQALDSKENGQDYIQQIFQKLIQEHPELEQTIHSWLIPKE